MKRTVYFYWETGWRAVAGRRERLPDAEARPEAAPVPGPAPDADWLASSAAGEEDPGASLDALNARPPTGGGAEPPRR